MEIKLHIEDCSSCGSDNVLLFFYDEDVECYCHSCKWSFAGKTEEDAIQTWNLHQRIGKLQAENERLKKRWEELRETVEHYNKYPFFALSEVIMIRLKMEELEKDGE